MLSDKRFMFRRRSRVVPGPAPILLLTPGLHHQHITTGFLEHTGCRGSKDISDLEMAVAAQDNKVCSNLIGIGDNFLLGSTFYGL